MGLILTDASAAAMRTHQQEKLEALRAAVINTALGNVTGPGIRHVAVCFREVLAMGYVRRVLVASIGAVSLIGASAVGAGAHDRGTLVAFDSMTPVTGSAVGTVNDRGITGGGLPWAITSGHGEVDRQGRIEVEVTGLVIPVPPFNGTNPASQMAATVSCLTPHGVVNVSTLPQTFPADAAGNVTIEGSVTLPHPCKDPILFVTSSGGAWFAESNSDESDD